MTVFVLGALHLDVVVNAPRLPRIGETLPGSAVDYRFGGKGGNQAVAAARMGVPVAMAGRIGQDQFGSLICKTLKSAGVDHSQVLLSDLASGMSVAITEAAGDYGAVIVSSANRDNDGVVDVPQRATVALIQNEIPEAANMRFAETLPAKMKLIANAAPAREMSTALAQRIDVLVVNAIEAADLSGSNDPASAATTLQAMGATVVIVTLGRNGVLVADADGQRKYVAHRVDVASTHGAGDAFTGTFAAELAGGAKLSDAVRTAQAAAAIVVSTPPQNRSEITQLMIRELASQSMP